MREQKTALDASDTLEAIQERYQKDPCFGKQHDPEHTSCIYCAVHNECGTTQGQLNFEAVKARKPKKGEHIDSKMQSSIQTMEASLDALPIGTTKYITKVIKHLAQAAEDGQPYTVQELREVLSADVDKLSGGELGLTLGDFITFINRVQKSSELAVVNSKFLKL